MNGPQHYAEAERLVSLAEIGQADPRDPIILAAAQVHATLAHAAAAVQPSLDYSLGADSPRVDGWLDALERKP